jgi:LuxR family maltose regulon positive regulatory protein
VIKRRRLTKLLDETDAQIILLTAPAGYGKTTLAHEWSSSRGRQALWFRAPTAAEDVAAVAGSLSRALLPLCASIEQSVRELLASLPEATADVEAIADLLAAEVGDWPVGTWLIIDEYEHLASHAASVKLIETLVARSEPRVLVTSRDRPTWVTPRDLLYGRAYELPHSELAMTDDEAAQVIKTSTPFRQQLAVLADGWPALLGLAALLPEDIDLSPELESTLFDYVAQELFAALSVDVRRELPLLALPSVLNATLIKAVTGEASHQVVREAVQVGLMTQREGGGVEIHPLCRAFLDSKLSEYGDLLDRIDSLAAHLIAQEQWDDAFALICRFNLTDHISALFRSGLQELLLVGRLQTLEKWLDIAEQFGYEDPAVALARAEIYLRQGSWRLAESLAISATRTEDFKLASYAHMCAGAAAQLQDAQDRADQHYVSALANEEPQLRRRALWGRFLCAVHGTHGAYHDALKSLEEAGDTAPEHILRIHQARLIAADRDGGLCDAADSAYAAEPLLKRVADPLVRTGFMNVLADALIATARYRAAEHIGTCQLSESRRFRLRFVLPWAFLTLAAASAGRGDYTIASSYLDRSMQEDETDDVFLQVKRETLRARLELARGDPRSAVHRLAQPATEVVRADAAGEGLAIRAFAAACAGDRSETERATSIATSLPTPCLARETFLAAARVAVALHAGRDATRALDRFATALSQTGHLDTLIWTTRGLPSLLHQAAQRPSMRRALRLTATRSEDASMASAIGIPSLVPRRKQVLSAREHDVLDLAAQGFHDREIARRLFISENTVKTHLRNIYVKWNVTSRTQAAMKARADGLLR